jgi:hypothetical protein
MTFAALTKINETKFWLAVAVSVSGGNYWLTEYV